MEKVFAKSIVKRFRPSGMETARLTNSGTEANMLAIAAALHFTKRRKVLVFSGGYHGGTLIFSMDLMKNRCNVNLPHDFVFAPFNNIEETKAIVQALPAESLAAILVEPVQGSGGCRPATREFIQYLRRSADDQRCLLIIDEVMTSRLCPNGCSAAMGIKADLMSLDKFAGDSMAFGAFGGRRDIMEVFDPEKSGLQHPGTYINNAITMSAGIAGPEEKNAAQVERLNALGIEFKTRIQEILITHGIYAPHPAGASRSIAETDSFKYQTMICPDSPSCPAHERLPIIFVTGYGGMVTVRFSGFHAKELQTLYYFHMLEHKVYLAPRHYTALYSELHDADVDKYYVCIQVRGPNKIG
ncbi:unnamed protein product [Clonostachys byssicola]|uniref:Uncharacterized protein n=1 Tax=Clonostachys byssicola TaxID=160290 RepID=A0A9N9Y6B9_9HYPO|nr:unnamed protein product [Clonostachys byssicola]